MDQPQEAARALLSLRQKVEKTCPVCGRVFVGFKQQRYCSTKCRVTAFRKRKNGRTVKHEMEKGQQEQLSTNDQLLLQLLISPLMRTLLSSLSSTHTCPICNRNITNIMLVFLCECGYIGISPIKSSQKNLNFRLESLPNFPLDEILHFKIR